MEPNDVVEAQQTSIIVVYLGIIICLVFTLSVNYIKDMQSFLHKKWDIQNATPADYTVKLQISDSQYSTFLLTQADKDKDEAVPLHK